MNVKLLFLILFAIALFYLTTSYIANNGEFSQTKVPHYNYLLNALYHKRLDVVPLRSATDLTFFEGKWYMYWGPAPVLFIAPFYLLFKTSANDVAYTLVAGITNIFLFCFALYEFRKAFKLKGSLFDLVFIILNFALASPHFYLSLKGQIWHTNQIVATTYLLVFFVFYFKFWQNKNLHHLFISTVFLSLAVLSRYTLVFYFVLLFPLFINLYKHKKKIIVKSIIVASLVTVSSSVSLFAYNFARFGNILETGTSYQDIRSSEQVFIPASTRTSLVGIKYIRHNIETYFLNHPEISNAHPFLKIDTEGNSMLTVYPLIILSPLLFMKQIFNKYKLFIITSVVGVILPIFAYLMFFLGTGWAQFGLRYMLDIVPLLFILLLLVARIVPKPIKVFLIIYGVSINLSGTLIFYNSVL